MVVGTFIARTEETQGNMLKDNSTTTQPHKLINKEQSQLSLAPLETKLNWIEPFIENKNQSKPFMNSQAI